MEEVESSLIHVAGLEKVETIIVFRDQAYPGAARNHAIKFASGDLVAFLDVRTIPRKQWLSSAELEVHRGVDLVWGKFLVATNSFSSRLLRDGIFGRKARVCLPGSLMKQSVFIKVGAMSDSMIAGEDREWMNRVSSTSNISHSETSFDVIYYGVEDHGLLGHMKKWWKYYSADNGDPLLDQQRVAAFAVLFLFFLVTTFNWNYVIADYFSITLFIPHITKIYVSGFAGFVIAYRGILRPLSLGVPAAHLFPFRFFLIASLCLLLDTVKVLGLLANFTTVSRRH